jgi:alkanesulfonate monooxygenase SsuD/methylene tetrahydromethanopterin reductase-like flavin-dependent oxidoreductase (luciferase family)
MRAARFGLPLMLAIIGGNPERFAPYVELYKRALQQQRQPALPIGLHSLGFVAPTDEEALEIQWPYWKEQFEWAARERGWRTPTREQFDAEVAHGSMYVGSPETVAGRIADVARTLSLSRFDLLYAVGRIPHEQRMATIELFGREVIPRVRELLADAPEQDDSPAVAPVAGS